MSRRNRLLIALLFAVLAWALYAATWQHGFVHYDDVRILREHPELYGQTSLAAAARAICVENLPREEPLLLRDLSWAFDSMCFGFGNPAGYHLGNILVHGLVVALLFLFLVANTPRGGSAVWTTALFLVLGVHVEPVAWIMGRKDLLSALFMLLALCAQTRRLTASSPRVATGWYVATVAALVAGLFSKISVLTFPAVLLLHGVLFPYLRGDRDPSQALPWRRLLRRELPLALPMFAVALVVFVWYRGMLAQMGLFERGYTASGLSHLWNLAMVNPLVWWLYLKQLCLPFHLSLAYTWPTLQSSLTWPSILTAVATLAAVLGTTLWMARRRKDLLFFWLAFFLLLVPYMNLIYIGIWAADRYLYLASFCLLAIAVRLAREQATRSDKARAAVVVGFAVVMLVNLGQTLSYQRAWRDAESLWMHHVTLPHAAPMAYSTLAASYYTSFGEEDEIGAQRQLMQKMAVVVEAGLQQFWPDRSAPPPTVTWQLLFLKAIVEEVGGHPHAAIESLLTSQRLNDRYPATAFNLAMLYRDQALQSDDPGQRRAYAEQARESLNAYHRRIATPAEVVAALGEEFQLERAVSGEGSAEP